MSGDHSHSHGVTATGRHRGALIGALAAALSIFVVEVVGALVSGSLALLADAGHVLADAGGVALALGATLLAARPAAGRRTFGWARAEILAAAANGLVLAGISVYVLVEGVRRLIDPAPVEVEHVHDVHDLHVYTVTSGLPVLTAHVVVDDECFHSGHAPQMLDAVGVRTKQRPSEAGLLSCGVAVRPLDLLATVHRPGRSASRRS
jgi:Co/Zn/Cd efflux system component